MFPRKTEEERKKVLNMTPSTAIPILQALFDEILKNKEYIQADSDNNKFFYSDLSGKKHCIEVNSDNTVFLWDIRILYQLNDSLVYMMDILKNLLSATMCKLHFLWAYDILYGFTEEATPEFSDDFFDEI
jgi:hypothetical protein